MITSASTGRVSYAGSIYDSTLDHSYEYDNVGRLVISHSGAEARAAAWTGQWGTMDGPYSQGYEYDPWGNVTHKYGWGGEVQGGGAGQSSDIWYYYTNNRRDSFGYDAAGNVINDGSQSFLYDATGQQTYAAALGGGGSAPTFTDNPLVVGVTSVRALHITELREAINAIRAHLGMSAYSWQYSATTNDYISANPIIEMRTALDQALGTPSGGYSAGLAQGQPIKAIHIQELRDRVTVAFNGSASATLYQYYDGDGLRVKKTESGATTWYLRSTVLGGQVVAELDAGGNWQRGYRAFGAIKGMNYGDGHALSTGYDNRLRPTTWNVSSVLGYNYSYDYFNEHTGRVSYAGSIYDSTLDRSYEYDQLGGLVVSHSGTEARAHAYFAELNARAPPPMTRARCSRLLQSVLPYKQLTAKRIPSERNTEPRRRCVARRRQLETPLRT